MLGPFNTKAFWRTTRFSAGSVFSSKRREGEDFKLDLMIAMPAGDEAVGKKGARSLESGWAAEAHRLPWLEVVEVSSQAAAAGEQLFFTSSGLSSFYTLRYRVLQPRDPERLDSWAKVHVRIMYVKNIVCLLAIDEEWQRTQCMPRETCVDVAKELGTDPSIFFKPPCVAVHRFVTPAPVLKFQQLFCLILTRSFDVMT